MGFLFGLLVGAAISGGGDKASPHLPAALSEIPFRCFAAIERSDDAYRGCRRLSMAAQLQQQHDVANADVTGIPNSKMAQAVAEAMDWEIAALHELEAAAKVQAPH